MHFIPFAQLRVLILNHVYKILMVNICNILCLKNYNYYQNFRMHDQYMLLRRNKILINSSIFKTNLN